MPWLMFYVSLIFVVMAQSLGRYTVSINKDKTLLIMTGNRSKFSNVYFNYTLHNHNGVLCKKSGQFTVEFEKQSIH